MTILKPAGVSPWSPQQRAVRRGVLAASTMTRGELLRPCLFPRRKAASGPRAATPWD
jgi:hypothetical protein